MHLKKFWQHNSRHNLVRQASNVLDLEVQSHYFEVESDKFVQILHNGHNHWLTISSVGTTPGQILVYDSMYPSSWQGTKQQIACLMRVSEPNLTLTFVNVQMQAGGSNCGAFALAFGTAICYGHSPGNSTSINNVCEFI